MENLILNAVTSCLLVIIVMALVVGIFIYLLRLYEKSNEKIQMILLIAYTIPLFLSIFTIQDNFKLSFISQGSLFALIVYFYMYTFIAMVYDNMGREEK